MGVHCEINLFKPADGTFLAGSTLSGVIKYGVDEPTVFDKITVSLKGHGLLIISDDRRRNNNTSNSYRHREVYVDTDHVIDNEKKTQHEVGMYETRFDFKLPDNIPSTLHYFKNNARYRIKCDIMYYIRIKFERPGFLQFAKRFKKELTVYSVLTSKLPSEPVMYGERKKLFQLFSSKDSIVGIKANIKKSVIPAGGRVDVEYEVCNDTNVTVKGVETKLVETYTFTTAGGREIKMVSDVDHTESKTGSVKSDEKQNFDIAMDVPAERTSLGCSSLVSRDYVVRITAALPFPHINAVLDIPVQLGAAPVEPAVEALDEALHEGQPPAYDAPPPSYWQVMGEDTKDDDFDNDKGGEKS